MDKCTNFSEVSKLNYVNRVVTKRVVAMFLIKIMLAVSIIPIFDSFDFIPKAFADEYAYSPESSSEVSLHGIETSIAELMAEIQNAVVCAADSGAEAYGIETYGGGVEIAPMMGAAQQTWREGWPTVDGTNWTPALSPTTGLTAEWNFSTGIFALHPWTQLATPATSPLGYNLGLTPAWPIWPRSGLTAVDTLVVNVPFDIDIGLLQGPLTAHVPAGRTVVLRGVQSATNSTPVNRTISFDSALTGGNHFRVHQGGRLILDHVTLCGGEGWSLANIANIGTRGGVTVDGVGIGIGTPGRLYLGRNSEIVRSSAMHGGAVDLGGGGLIGGGGIILNPSGGWLTTHPTSNIEDNVARNGAGVWGGANSTIRLAGTIYDNSARGVVSWLPGILVPSFDDGQGGGVWATSGTRMDIASTAKILENDANFGGGIYIEGESSIDFLAQGSRLTMHGGYIRGNTAYDSDTIAEIVSFGVRAGIGGGIYSTARTDVILRGGVIEDNLAQGFTGAIDLGIGRPQRGFGGGLFAGEGAQVVMYDSTIRNNEAVYGGGVMLQGRHVAGTNLLGTRVRMIMHDGLIEGNEVGPHGGAIINTGGSGGGIRVDRSANFYMHGGVIRDNHAHARTVGGSNRYPIPGSGNGAGGTGGGGVGVGFNSHMYGALDTNRGGEMRMFGGVIEENSAIHGGGIRVSSGRTLLGVGGLPGFLFVHGGEIRNNYAERDGGGVWIQSNCDFYLGDNNPYRSGNAGNVDPANPPVIYGNEAGAFGGGVWIAYDTHFGMDHVRITNNHAGQDGGGIFISTPTYGDPLPTRAYRLRTGTPTIWVRNNMQFEGNTADNGWFIPAVNAGTFANGRIPYSTSAAPSSLVSLGVTHSLNNYDINYRGQRAFTFVKLCDEGYPLPGAQFRLEHQNAQGGWDPVKNLAGETTVVSRAPDGLVGAWELTTGGTYRLLETQAPENFITPTGYWTVVWQGGVPAEDSAMLDILNGQFNVDEHDGNFAFDRGTDGVLRVENEYVGNRAPLHLYKWSDHTEEGLAEVTFRLEREEWCTTTSAYIWTPIGNPILTTAPDYRISLALTRDSSYRLRETAVPSGYQLPPGHWLLDVAPNGAITVTSSGTVPAMTENAPFPPFTSSTATGVVFHVVNYRLPDILPTGLVISSNGVAGVLIATSMLLLGVSLFRKRSSRGEGEFI